MPNLYELVMRMFLVITAFLFCIGSQAQLRVGAQVGISRVKWTPTNTSTTNGSYSTSRLINLQGGLVSQINLLGAWHLRSGVLLSGKGTTQNHQSDLDTSSLKIWLRYIELPVVLVYQSSISKKIQVFAGAGFYGAYGLNGVAKGEGKNKRSGLYYLHSAVEFRRKNENQTYPPVIEPFDYGYTFLAGMERHRIQVLFSYSQGLKALMDHTLFNADYKNSVLALSAAYLLR